MQSVPSRVALRRLIPYLAEYKAPLFLGLLFVVTASAASNAIPALLRQAIDGMAEPANTGQLRNIALVMLVTAAVSGALRFGMREILNSISRRIETDLRRDVFAKLLVLDAAWFARMRTGDLMAKLTNDVQAVRMATGPAIMYFVNTIFGALFSLIMMARISPLLTVAALLPLIGLPVLMIRLGRAVHQRFEAVQTQFSTLSTRAQENIAGVRIVRAYQQEPAEIARYAEAGDDYLDRNMRLARLNGLMNPGFGLLAGLGGAITLGLGGRLLIAGTLSVGGFVAFGIYLAMLTWPLIALGWTINLFQRGAASMARVMTVLDAEPEQVHDSGSAQLPPLTANTSGRALEFRGVGFAYPAAPVSEGAVSEGAVSEDAGSEAAGSEAAGSEGAVRNAIASDAAHDTPRWVLRDLSFTVPVGGTLAIVGATGSGKSALLDLVPRFYDAQEGEILLDGVPIRSLPLATLRAEIGYVPQDTTLFSETIGGNVGYGLANNNGMLSETVPDAVRDATQIAQLADTIAELPDGFATALGERGINLSGGQKQRTALARALARAPRLVLLDDALSAVDTQTEAAILNGLRTALAGRTAIIASHRVSAVRDADWILVLDQGRVVEQGHHDDLIASDGRYAQLLHRQQLLEAVEAA